MTVTTLTAVTMAALLAAASPATGDPPSPADGPVVTAGAGDGLTGTSGSTGPISDADPDGSASTDDPTGTEPDGDSAATSPADVLPPTDGGGDHAISPEEVSQAVADGEAIGADETLGALRVLLSEGYHEDGTDRPLWWMDDGLHFRDPIPANGYVNIDVPGAQNLSIDTDRDESAVLAADDTVTPRALAVTGAGTTALWWAAGLLTAGALARVLTARVRRVQR